MSRKKEQMNRHTYVRMTDSQMADLEKLARLRNESKSDALRACLSAVVNRAKKKGIWDK